MIALCLAVALFAAAGLVLLIGAGDRTQLRARLKEVTVLSATSHPHGIRHALQYFSRTLLPFRRFLRLKGDEALAYQLALAGYRKPENMDSFLSAKLLGPVLGVLLATFGGGNNVLLLSLLLGAAGFFAPDLYLFRTISRRKRAIALSLPDAMDLLVICMEAGLGMDQATLRVATELTNVAPALCDELLMITREQRAGKPRADAWRGMADRINVDIVSQFAGMLAQCERLGTPIAKSLGQFADTLRTKRLLEAEERAAKSSIKLIPPLVIFVFPAMFVVILGPAILAISHAFE
ncbi:MAG TPA: type II secretion system F family protein [Candidatus Bathyarchaeia archaeon]|nr:type II secretion system F family protein [Candidatus Bathyarchaeia archaeon]